MKFGRIPHEAIDLISKLLTLDPPSRLSASDCLLHPFLSCTQYPQNSLGKPVVDNHAFAHEHSEVTIDELRQEILNEVSIYHPDWNQNGYGESSDDEPLVDLVPTFGSEANALDLNPSLEQTVINTKADLIDVPLVENMNPPISFTERTRSTSNASVASCQTEVREWTEEELVEGVGLRSSLESRHSRILSSATVLDGCDEHRMHVDSSLNDTERPFSSSSSDINKEALSDQMLHVSSDTVVPVQSAVSLDFFLDSTISDAIPNRPCNAGENLDCNSLFSLSFCSSNCEVLEDSKHSIANGAVSGISGKKRTLQSSRSLDSTGSFGTGSGNAKMLRKDSKNSSCVIS